MTVYQRGNNSFPCKVLAYCKENDGKFELIHTVGPSDPNQKELNKYDQLLLPTLPAIIDILTPVEQAQKSMGSLLDKLEISEQLTRSPVKVLLLLMHDYFTLRLYGKFAKELPDISKRDIIQNIEPINMVNTFNHQTQAIQIKLKKEYIGTSQEMTGINKIQALMTAFSIQPSEIYLLPISPWVKIMRLIT